MRKIRLAWTILVLVPLSLAWAAEKEGFSGLGGLTPDERARPWEQWTEEQLAEKGWVAYPCCSGDRGIEPMGRRWDFNDPGPWLQGSCVSYSFIEDQPLHPRVPLCHGLLNKWTDMPAGRQAAVKRAIATWEATADVHFIEVVDNLKRFNAAGAVGEIRIGAHAESVAGFDHGDGPGTGVVIAHTFYPPINGITADGDVHFWPEPPPGFDGWHTGAGACPPNFADLETVALHELGHALGLDHMGQVAGEVMFGVYGGQLRIMDATTQGFATAIYGAAGHAAECSNRNPADFLFPGDGEELFLWEVVAGEENAIEVGFLAPEIEQSTFCSVDPGGLANFSYDVLPGNPCMIALSFHPEESQVGEHGVLFTATDDGDPQGITELELIVRVDPPTLVEETDWSVLKRRY